VDIFANGYPFGWMKILGSVLVLVGFTGVNIIPDYSLSELKEKICCLNKKL
jgi:hypothetical protein